MHKEITHALEGASFTHYEEFIELDGQDNNWALWYAQWLLAESEVADVLSEHLTAEKLAHILARLDGQFQHSDTSLEWCEFYAHEIERYLQS